MTDDPKTRLHELSPEIVSLVHHVELSQAAWRDKASQQLVAAQLWLLKEATESSQLVRALADTFGIEATQNNIETALKSLDSEGIVTGISENTVILSEHGLRILGNRLEEAKSIDTKVKGQFAQHFTEFCPQIDVNDAWSRFNDQLLLPIVEDSGARVYELLVGKRSLLERFWFRCSGASTVFQEVGGVGVSDSIQYCLHAIPEHFDGAASTTA